MKKILFIIDKFELKYNSAPFEFSRYKKAGNSGFERIIGIGFILFAKIFNIIVDNNIDSLLLYINGNFIDKLNFIFNGYSFIGG